jgi:hypothetical protein
MSLYGKAPPPPRVGIEYDARGKRMIRYFANAYQARRFYLVKLSQGKNPVIRKGS